MKKNAAGDIPAKKMLIVSDVPVFTIKEGIGIKVIEKTLEGYSGRGYDIDLVYPSYQKKADVSTFKNMSAVNDYSFYAPVYFKWIHINYLSYISRAFSWITFSYKLKKLYRSTLRNRDYDLLYGIGPFGSYIIHQPFLRKGTPLRVSRFLGVASAYKRHKSLLKKPLIFPFILGYKAESDLAIMTNDGTQGDEFIKEVNPGIKKILFLKNGIDKNVFLPGNQKEAILKKHQLSPDVNILLTVNRLSHQKRVDRLIGLIPSIVEKTEAKLIIVGDGEKKPALQELAEKSGVAEHIIFTGALPHSEIVKYYHAADLFYLVNETNNATNPLFEAMFTGNCVIAVNNGDTADFVPDGTGVLVDEENIDSIPEITLRLLHNPALKKEMAQKAYNHIDSMIQSWEERITFEIDRVEELMQKS